jgi:hypothetical protein
MKRSVSARLNIQQLKAPCFIVVMSLLASVPGAFAHVNAGYNCAGCHTTVTGVTTITNSPGTLAVNPRLDGGSTSALPCFTAKPGDTITVSLKATPKGISGDQFAFAITGLNSSTIASGALSGVKFSTANKLSYTPTTPAGWTKQSSGAYFTEGPLSWTSSSTASFSITISSSTPSDVYSLAFRSSGLDSNAGNKWTQAFEFLINVQLATPIVTTGPASSLTTSGAVVSGTVNPNGTSTSAYFQYGTTTSYGSVSGTQALGAGTSALAFSGTLSGLNAGTVYHYRAVGVSTSGTGFGSDQTFTTVFNPPSVTTGTASNIAPQSATLNATVNPNGLATTAWYEYGLDTNYGSSTSSQSVGSGTTATAVSAGISGLGAGTTYHYRVVAASATGTTQGADQSFTTLPPAPSVATGSASAIATQSATLNGTVIPNGLSTSGYFQYGTTTSYGSVTATQALGAGSSAVALSGTLSGLNAGTVYHFRAVGVSTSGTSFGSDQSLTTAFNPPSVATGSASNIAPQSATVNATVNPNGLATTAWYEYGLDTNYGSSTTSQSVGSGTTATAFAAGISGLGAGTTYHYRVVAASATGTTQGADQSFATLPPAPTVATGSASVITYQSATLNGTVNPNGVATTYYFQYGATTAYGSTTGPQSAGSGSSAAAANAPITGLSPAGTYHFQIVAVSTSGTSFGADQSFVTPNGPPVAITGTASAIASSGATLNGSVNPGGLSTSYYFQYGLTTAYGTTTGTQGAGSVSGAQSVNAAVLALSASTSYHFQLVAVNASGTTFGADQTFTTLPPAPVATTGSASAISVAGATLNGMVDPNGLAATSWYQYGTTTSYGSATAQVLLASGTSFAPVSTSISGLNASTTYHFQLVTVTASGTSFGADQLFVTLSGPPVVITGSASAVAGQSATLNGSVNPNGADTSVYFKYGTTSSYGSVTGTQGAGSGASAAPISAAVSGLTPKTTYHFAIVAVSASGTTTGADQSFTTTASSNNNLANLLVSSGSLAPGFASAQTSYSCAVANSVAKLTVTPTAADAGAKIGVRINGAAAFAAVASGKASAALSLNAGSSNVVEVKVTAPDSSAKTYSIAVYRLAAPVTGNASVNVTDAVLNGTVDGHAGSFTFQYGLTTAYGQSSPVQAVASGSSTVVVSATLTGLVPAATYHYRLVSVTGSVSDFGSDATCVTSRAYAAPEVAAQGDLAPGISLYAKFLGFGTPAINYSSSKVPSSDHWAFQALVSGSGITKLNNSGIWLYGGIQNPLLAHTGDAAPGGGVFATLRNPVLNNNDEVAFLGTVAGAGVAPKTSQGIWATTSGSLHLVARTQITPLDGQGAVAASFQQVVLPDHNGVVFLANLVNGVGGTVAATNQGIWVENNGHLTKLIRKGDPLIGGTVGSISLFGSPLVPAVGGQSRNFDSQGNLSFKVIFTNGTQAVYVLSGTNTFTPVLATGTLGAGLFAAPTKILSLGNPILNEAGNTAFLAFVSGTAKGSVVAGSILAETGSFSQMGVVAVGGGLAPNANGVLGLTGSFATLSDPVFNGKDQVAFIGKLKTGGLVTGANAQGIWTNTSGQLALAARAGSPAPDCPAGTNFQLFTQLALPEEGGVVFTANLNGAGVKSATNQGIWAADNAGSLHLVARKGDVLVINGSPKVVASISIFGSTQGTAGQTRSFNAMGDLIYKVTFTDKTQALRKVVFP